MSRCLSFPDFSALSSGCLPNHPSDIKPHFHAYYQEHASVFSISPVDLISGSLPQRQQRLVEAWAEIHHDELLADWQLCRMDNDLRQSPL